ncbi:Mediator of RNA polymerase II transcription subunit 11, partial [Fragariocoptes setiger]
MAQTTSEITKLDNIEKDLIDSLHEAGQTINELAKDKPNAKMVDTLATKFLGKLESIESELSRQIAYLTRASTGQSHEGSSYGCQKDQRMAQHRLDIARKRLDDLLKVSVSD